TDSWTETSTPSWCRQSAATNPPMPPPAMSTRMPRHLPRSTYRSAALLVLRRLDTAEGIVGSRLPRDLLQRAVELLVPGVLLGFLQQVERGQTHRTLTVNDRVVQIGVERLERRSGVTDRIPEQLVLARQARHLLVGDLRPQGHERLGAGDEEQDLLA